VLPFGAPIRPRMKVKSGHYNRPETCRTAFVIPDHKAILLLLLLWTQRNVIHGNTIRRVKDCKFVGIIIDDRMSWKPHIHSITSTVAWSHVGVMKRIRSKIDARTALLL